MSTPQHNIGFPNSLGSPDEETSFSDFIDDDVMHNSGVPPRTTVPVRLTAVAARLLVFHLPAAMEIDYFSIPSHKRSGSIFECGIPGLPRIEDVEAALLRLPAFLIGLPHGQIDEKVPRVTVKDPAATLALLSRRTGQLYVRSRQPDYAMAKLANDQFVVEDYGFMGEVPA